MRLGEIKQKIFKCINENNQLIVDHEALYGNQLYKINNYGNLIDVFDILKNYEWNDTNMDAIISIVEEFGEELDVAQIPVSQFNQLNTYVSQLNRKLPLYYSILETMVDDQDEQLINIKIPENNIASLDDLAKFTDRLNKILKRFNIDGEFEFVGLESGSSWYRILFLGTLTYNVFIGSLNLSQNFFETKEAYFNSKQAEFDYKASLEKNDEFSDKGLKEYTNKRLEIELNENLKEMLDKMDISNGKGEQEINNQIIKATTELIKELGKGTEFHLSLNPPKYVSQSGGSLEIDYKQISALIEKENKPKELEDKLTDPLENEE